MSILDSLNDKKSELLKRKSRLTDEYNLSMKEINLSLDIIDKALSKNNINRYICKKCSGSGEVCGTIGDVYDCPECGGLGIIL